MWLNVLSQKPGIEGPVIHILYVERYKIKKMNNFLTALIRRRSNSLVRIMSPQYLYHNGKGSPKRERECIHPQILNVDIKGQFAKVACHIVLSSDILLGTLKIQ